MSVVGGSVKKEAEKLYERIAVIEDGIREVAAIITGKKHKLREHTTSTQNLSIPMPEKEKPEDKMIAELLG